MNRRTIAIIFCFIAVVILGYKYLLSRPQYLIANNLACAFIASKVEFSVGTSGVPRCVLSQTTKAQGNKVDVSTQLREGKKLVFVFDPDLVQQLEFDLSAQKNGSNISPRVFLSISAVHVTVLSMKAPSGEIEIDRETVGAMFAWAQGKNVIGAQEY